MFAPWFLLELSSDWRKREESRFNILPAHHERLQLGVKIVARFLLDFVLLFINEVLLRLCNQVV